MAHEIGGRTGIRGVRGKSLYLLLEEKKADF